MMKLMRNPDDGGVAHLVNRAMRFHLSGVTSQAMLDFAGWLRFHPRDLTYPNLEAGRVAAQFNHIPIVYHPFYHYHRMTGHQVWNADHIMSGRSHGMVSGRMFGISSQISAVSVCRHIMWIEAVMDHVSRKLNGDQDNMVNLGLQAMQQTIHPHQP